MGLLWWSLNISLYMILESLLLLHNILFQNVAILNLIIISTGKRPISP
jgi:hypothetical protein